MEIQIIIRVPDQNIEDQVINCNLDWTILKLKNHLSEVYPTRPMVEEQKLIYSGHLLADHLKLRNIIRHEDMQSSVHILHLVCKGSNSSPVDIPSSSQDSSSQPLSVQSPHINTENIETSENIFRHGFNLSAPLINNTQMQHQQIHVNTLPLYPMNPQVMAQITAMQQMYAHYFAQYWQSLNIIASTANYPLNSTISNIQLVPNNTIITSEDNVQQQQINQRNNNAPPVQPVEDNDFANRDWLDQLFLYFRFLILLSIVYFYTTPERFMLVIIFVVIAFLYHEGWFVRQGIAEAVIGQRNRAQVEPNNTNEQQSVNDNEGEDGHELEAIMDGDDPTHALNPDAANNNNNNNQVFSPLTFLATFFSSLIPETPPPVNIN